MSETTFTVLIHHDGRFIGDMRRRYIGGRVTQVCDDLGIDKVSYPEIMSYVKEDLRYELDSILSSGAKLEFYVDHKNIEKEVTLPVQREVTEVGDIEQGVMNVADWESQIDVNLQNNQGSQSMVNKNIDNEMGDGLLQQTFDNLNDDIDLLTDDNDEELQQSRENIKAFKSKNTYSMKHNMTTGEDDSHCDDEIDAYGDDIMLDVEDDEVYIAGLESDNDSTGSFYYDSDDNCSYYSETDEECGDHALRRPSKMVCFDPMAVIPVFCCGMTFKTVQECRDALAKYAIMKGLQIHFIKNDQVRVSAGCMEKCPWKFLASKNGHNNNFTVKTYVPNHKCHRKNTNPMATSNNLAKLLRERLMATHFIKYKDLKNLCRTELKLKISLTQARNIREKVIADLLGSYAEEYKRLHDYVQEINASNPGTTCVVTQGNNRNMKRKNTEINESTMTNPSAELVKEFMKEKKQVKGSTSNKASSQVQQAPDRSSSQSQRPIRETRENYSSKEHIHPNQQGKESITTTKVRQSKLPTGYGCYVNENTGQTILNPGTRYMKSLYREPMIMEEHSQDANKNVPRRENHGTSGLKWKGKNAVTIGQLQAEAQRKVTSVTTQAKGRKECGS
ncbi:hypothetical protein C2S52_013351 [Perilla frutescens var. hirtella]|nr:hypothetical protein C2S52_013351 [Perilla frutescens var. hirtella]